MNIHSENPFHNYFMSAFYVQGTILGTGDTAVNKNRWRPLPDIPEKKKDNAQN